MARPAEPAGVPLEQSCPVSISYISFLHEEHGEEQFIHFHGLHGLMMARKVRWKLGHEPGRRGIARAHVVV